MIKDVARYDKGIVKGEARITEEGFLKARAIVTRCGVFLYKNPDGTIRKELRHPDDVLQLESIDSMKMIPVVDGHPSERLVTSSNAKKLSVGYTGELIEKESPYIVANLVITDADTVKAVKGKKKNELSLGYTVDLVAEKGHYYGEPYEFRQTNIRYNHLALVDKARAGPEARIALDRADAFEVSQEELEMTKKKVVFDNAQEYMVEGDVHEQITKLQENHKRLTDELESSKEALRKAEAQRDAMKDNAMEKIESSKEGVEFPGKVPGQGEQHTHNKMMKGMEKDEVGSNGKEIKDMSNKSGPTDMRNNPVNGPKGNEHYPADLPRIAKVDEADVRKAVNERMKVYLFAQRVLPKDTVAKLDSMSDLEIKTAVVKARCPKSNLDGKDQHYISARFDMLQEETQTTGKPNAAPAKYEKRAVNADGRPGVDPSESRNKMIQNMQNSWKVEKKHASASV